MGLECSNLSKWGASEEKNEINSPSIEYTNEKIK